MKERTEKKNRKNLSQHLINESNLGASSSVKSSILFRIEFSHCHYGYENT